MSDPTLAERLAAVLGPELEYGLGVEGDGTIGLGTRVEGFTVLLELAERGQRSAACGCHAGDHGDDWPFTLIAKDELGHLESVADAAVDFLDELDRPGVRPARVEAEERSLRDALAKARP